MREKVQRFSRSSRRSFDLLEGKGDFTQIRNAITSFSRFGTEGFAVQSAKAEGFTGSAPQGISGGVQVGSELRHRRRPRRPGHSNDGKRGGPKAAPNGKDLQNRRSGCGPGPVTLSAVAGDLRVALAAESVASGPAINDDLLRRALRMAVRAGIAKSGGVVGMAEPDRPVAGRVVHHIRLGRAAARRRRW